MLLFFVEYYYASQYKLLIDILINYNLVVFWFVKWNDHRDCVLVREME